VGRLTYPEHEAKVRNFLIFTFGFGSRLRDYNFHLANELHLVLVQLLKQSGLAHIKRAARFAFGFVFLVAVVKTPSGGASF
jgi:hypothetical protein